MPLIVNAPQRFAPRRVEAAVSLSIWCRRWSNSPAARTGRVARRTLAVPHLLGGGGMTKRSANTRRGRDCADRDDPARAIKFIHSPADPDQLYDLAADPCERAEPCVAHRACVTVAHSATRSPDAGTSPRCTTKCAEPAPPPHRRRGAEPRRAEGLGFPAVQGRGAILRAQHHPARRTRSDGEVSARGAIEADPVDDVVIPATATEIPGGAHVVQPWVLAFARTTGSL